MSRPERNLAGETGTSTDSDLMIRTINGDRLAFDQLVRRYYRKVYATSYRLLGSPEEAEDATQEIFLKVYQAAGRFRPEMSFSTWLYRISVNHCLNVLRWKRRRRWLSLSSIFHPNDESEGEEFGVVLPSSPDTRPDEMLERAEISEAVRRAIFSLPEKQRVALILHRYEGLSYKEIAEIMGTTVSSVESRLHRAKVTLAKRLEALLELRRDSARRASQGKIPAQENERPGVLMDGNAGEDESHDVR